MPGTESQDSVTEPAEVPSNPNVLGHGVDVGRKGDLYQFTVDGLKFAKNVWTLSLKLESGEMEKIESVVRFHFVPNPKKYVNQLRDAINEYNSNQTQLPGSAEKIVKHMLEVRAKYEQEKKDVKTFDFSGYVTKYSDNGTNVKVGIDIPHDQAAKFVNNFNVIAGSTAVVIAAVDTESE